MTTEPLSAEVLATLVSPGIAVRSVRLAHPEGDPGDENRRTWFLVTDYLIILSLCSLVLVCIVLPFAGHSDPSYIAKTISAAYVAIASFPINTAAHYRLFSRYGRAKYRMAGRDVPYITDQEAVTLAATLIALSAVIYYVG